MCVTIIYPTIYSTLTHTHTRSPKIVLLLDVGGKEHKNKLCSDCAIANLLFTNLTLDGVRDVMQTTEVLAVLI